MTDHRPRRPTWLCTACGRQWPCPAARQDLLREHVDARVPLALDLARDFGDAIADLPGVPVPELYVRFLGWVRRMPAEGGSGP
jgi:hypothetical protein